LTRTPNVLEEKHDWKKLGGNADGYQKKGVAGKAIRKTMKTKG
jgi:hypothetical protein